MKTRGMTFTGPSILALMTCAECGTLSPGICPECGSPEKLKGLTRRVMSPQPPHEWSIPPARVWGGHFNRWGCDVGADSIKCPHQPGDIVYAREAWRTVCLYELRKPVELPGHAPIWYNADGPPPETYAWGRYRHARFLPKRFARIWREVVAVRAERVQDISEEDAIAEGVKGLLDELLRADQQPGIPHRIIYTTPYKNMREVFRALWDTLHAKRHGGAHVWEKDPVVFVYTLAVSSTDHRGTETQRGE